MSSNIRLGRYFLAICIAASASGAIGATVPGTIPGEFNVGSQGAAIYTIPITGPNGAGGMNPNLALVYDHTSGNGLAGMRWTLHGISRITRCQHTYGQDGFVSPITNTSADRFCLDGQRLVSPFGGTYGATGTEYRTEFETFQRIVQLGQQAGGPSSFRVDHPDGTSSHYGTTEDSRFAPAGTVVRAWFISHTEDQFGNRINYLYDEDSLAGEIVPREIAWTQNAGQGLAPKYKITITYESRPASDVRTGFDSANSPVAATKRIDRIDITYDSQTIHAYDFAYSAPPVTGTGRSQLASVTKCGPTDCQPPTTFAVQNGTRGWNASFNTTYSTGANHLVGDQNGDGKKDMFVSLSGTWQVYYGKNGTGFDIVRNSHVSSATNPQKARVIDYNGDGRDDLLVQVGSTWHVLQHAFFFSPFIDIDTGISTSSPGYADIRDFDGDGLEDWLYIEGGQLNWRRNTGGAFAAAQTLAAGYAGFSALANVAPPDVNGDGRAEFVASTGTCQTGPNGWEVCTGDHYLLTALNGSYQNPIGITTGEIGTPRAIDINGDGLHDVAYTFGGTWRFRISHGLWLGGEVNTSIPSSNADKVLVADYDSDGRGDLIRPEGDYWLVHRSDSSTLPVGYEESLYSPGAGSGGGFLDDTNGDGFPEIVRASGGTWHIHNHKTALPDVVTTITDGLDHFVQIGYSPLSDYGSLGGAGSPPYIQFFGGPAHVVSSSVRDSATTSGMQSFSHSYSGAVIDVARRSNFVVYSHKAYEPQGTNTETTFFQTFPSFGRIKSVTLQRDYFDETIIRGTTNFVLGTTTWTNTTPNRHFLRVESSTSEEGEVADPFGGTVRTVVEDPAYDTTYGFITQLTRTVTQPSPSQQWQTVTQFNPTSFITTTEWCLGLPGLVHTTSSLPNFTSSVRSVSHTFDPLTCRLSETRDESEASPAKQLKTNYAYNPYGNVMTVAEDSVDGSAQNRSTAITYDANQQFPATVTAGTVNLTTTMTWNYLFGERASLQTSDLVTTSWLYDDFGRLKRETRPVGYSDITFGDCSTCWPLNARFFVRAQGSDGADTYEYFDRQQRLVGTAETLPLGTQGRRELRYNLYGQVVQISQPYVMTDPVYWATMQYEQYWGRLKQENAPVSEVQPSGAITTYEYRANDLWITNPENSITKYTHNALQQVVQVVDAMNGTTAYTYKHFGELATLQDAEFNTTTIGYDARGFKASLADPNMGTWTYDTNVYGELTHQRSPLTVAPAWTTTLTYDEGGRIKTRVETEGTTTWSYYAAGNGARGKVDTMVGPGNTQKYTYHATHGLPTQIRHTVGGTNYFYDLTYDGQARLDVLTYPTSTSSYRFKVDYDYDTFGHNTVAKDGNTPSLVYYRLEGADAFGRELQVTLGSGLHEYRDYDRAAGHLRSIQTDLGLGSAIQDLSFSYDEVGNVLSRTNANIGKTETFTYDDLNRLATMQVSGLAGVTMGYSAAGRITARTDLGSYTYTGTCGGGPMAVKNAAGKAYCYDASGRMTSRGGSAITWFSYDLPRRINNGTASTEFTYGVDRARITQTRRTGSTTNATIRYIGDLLEREVAGSTTTWRHYVSARGRVVAQVNRVGTVNTAQYLHRDHQGSVAEITSSTGALVQSLAFDAWGLRRNAATWAPLASPFAGTQPTKRGYTGHEHLDNVELVHMNGRVQDPRLGLFISADPFVQAPYHSQSHNRYAYVWNNPASLIDPSGFQIYDEGPAPVPIPTIHRPGPCAFCSDNYEGSLNLQFYADADGDIVWYPGTEVYEETRRVDLERQNELARQGRAMIPDDGAIAAFGRGFGGEGRSLMAGEPPFAESLGRGIGAYGGAALTGASVALGGVAIVRLGLGRLLAARGMAGATELLRPGGQLIGTAGSRDSIRVLQGGAAQAEKLFQQLSAGGRVVTRPGHPGTLVELPGGGFVGYRPVSASGPPTIDVNIPGLAEIAKIKFVP